jgi:hypothetical protein
MAKILKEPTIVVRRVEHQVVWHKIVGRIAWLILGLAAIFYGAT